MLPALPAMPNPALLPAALDAELRALVDEYRARCLWFLRPDLYPADCEQALRVLGHIETRGDREGFVRARRLRERLSASSSDRSAGS